MTTQVLLDTDVAIDYLRGQSAAIGYVSGLSDPPLISVVTVAELYAGVREGEERKHLESFLSGLRISPLTHAMAIEAGLMRRQFRRKG